MAHYKLRLIVTIILSSIIVAQNNDSNIHYSSVEDSAFHFGVNKLQLPFNNIGHLGEVGGNNHTGGTFDEASFLYSSGFYLSGKSNNTIWANGTFAAGRIEDYQPGIVDENPNDPLYKIYVVKDSDPPFGDSWNQWRTAVALGAKFYDGNNDGVYNPVDYNGNGEWDTDEDRPDIQGDLTTWCVYNDGVPRELRRYWVQPQGVQVKQTIFASAGEGTNYKNIIFIRYILENVGTVVNQFDSVYFSVAVDTDLGDYRDDLIGCDTLRKSVYVYNSGVDQNYGNNPPSFFVTQLQGPPVFIPGETFIDNDNDGNYNSGVDTPIDSAVVKRGNYLGKEYIKGAKNLEPTAFIQYFSPPPSIVVPETHLEMRRYLLGGTSRSGEPIDPCTWYFGNGTSLLYCSELNPKWMYSGDPVSGTGWLNTTPHDQRFYQSTGPFQLAAGKPIELIYAYIVGRGTDHLNSITVAREIADFAQTVYDNNFQDLPTGIDDDENLVAKDFQLYQNYPNPFNPVTTIKFSVPVNGKGEMSNVKLIVFDLLGREVKTLVNEVKSSGSYKVQFDASALASGVYFYQLQAGDFVNTKKLMLLK